MKEKTKFAATVAALCFACLAVMVWFDVGWLRLGVVAIVMCVGVSLHLAKYGPTTKQFWFRSRRGH